MFFLFGKVVQKLHVWRLFLTTPLAACHLAFWTDGGCCSQNLQFLTTSNLQPFAGGPQPSGIQLFVSKQMSFRLKALRTHLKNDFLEIREGTPKSWLKIHLGRNMMEHDRTIVINISKLLLFSAAVCNAKHEKWPLLVYLSHPSFFGSFFKQTILLSKKLFAELLHGFTHWSWIPLSCA